MELSLAFLGDPSSVHVQRWLGFFVRRGHSVHLLVTADSAVEASRIAAEGHAPDHDDGPSLRGVNIVALAPYPRSSVPFLGYLEARRAMQAALRDIRADVLHAHYLTGYGWLARVSGFHPYGITTWGSDIYLDPKRSLQRRIFARLALGAADLVTADSRDLAAAAISLGAPSDRVRVMQFGVEMDRFTPGPPPADLRTALDLDGRRVIFSPRAIKPLYQHETLVRALPALPTDVTAVFVRFNAQPTTIAELEELADRLGVRDRVRFVPSIAHDDMPAYLRLADLVVSIPASDGTPVTVLEAMAVGRPVVVTDLPSLQEWLADIDPGALVPVGDVDRLAESIRQRLDRSPTSSATIAAAGRQLIDARANHETNLREVERVYEALAHHGRAA